MANLLGIDIGTTNIEYAYLSSDSDNISLYIERNPLARYGLDVMTRITKANSGLLEEMGNVLRESISKKISEINHDIDSIKIAANTTMVHLLMKYDCTNLGSFPFSPVHLEEIQTKATELGLSSDDIPVIITPGLSAFVGGDIVSGLCTINDNDNFLLIDLGTNAEMVLVKGNVAYITSAAAGPAFETCSYGHATDAIDGLVYMLESDVMDETGLLDDEYFDNGYDCNNMHFSQKKIRDFQMAKSAIRTGIDLLVGAANSISASRFSKDNLKIYIAGTFGAHLNIANAIRLGMFPEWFEGKCEALGNTSLAGTLTDENEYTIFQKEIREIVLANLPDFNDYYISNMNF